MCSYGCENVCFFIGSGGRKRRRRKDDDGLHAGTSSADREAHTISLLSTEASDRMAHRSHRWMISYGTYTLSPPNVLPFSSKSFFNRTATFRTHSRQSSRPRQLPATIQHSEHALDAEFTVSNSSSPRACSAVRISTNRLSPALHVFIPPVGLVVVSDTRYEDESSRQVRSALWSIVDDVLVIVFNTSSI